MKDRIKKELENRLNNSESKFINIVMRGTGKTVQISEQSNIWTNEKFYAMSFVVLDDCKNVISAENIACVDSLDEVANIIMNV